MSNLRVLKDARAKKKALKAKKPKGLSVKVPRKAPSITVTEVGNNGYLVKPATRGTEVLSMTLTWRFKQKS